jgi:hypothetical protein
MSVHEKTFPIKKKLTKISIYCVGLQLSQHTELLLYCLEEHDHKFTKSINSI